jgi:hypothetical protein
LQRRLEGANPSGDGGLFALFFAFVCGLNILACKGMVLVLVPVSHFSDFGDVLDVLAVLEGSCLRPTGPKAHP